MGDVRIDPAFAAMWTQMYLGTCQSLQCGAPGRDRSGIANPTQWELAAITREQRRSFLAISARRQRPGSGSDLVGLMRGRRIVATWWQRAEQALSGIPHAAVGAVAAAAYMPQRLTQDLDLAVAITDVARAEAALAAAGWRRTSSLAIGGSAWQLPTGERLDLLAIDEPWGAEALASAKRAGLGDLPVLPLPYLVWMKLRAARPQDLADVARMTAFASADALAATRAVVHRYGKAEDVEDLEQIIALGRLERQ